VINVKSSKRIPQKSTVTFRDFIRVNKKDMTLLGDPVIKGKA